MKISEICRGISAAETISGRSNLIYKDGFTIIDDCYNANPVSMRASLDVLSQASGRKIAILGDMGELGENEKLLHAGVGSYAAEIEIDILKIVCLTPFMVADETPPKAKIGDAESVLTHIRNAFAHGNTYFFDNENMMLEDKNNGTITARI